MSEADLERHFLRRLIHAGLYGHRPEFTDEGWTVLDAAIQCSSAEQELIRRIYGEGNPE